MEEEEEEEESSDIISPGAAEERRYVCSMCSMHASKAYKYEQCLCHMPHAAFVSRALSVQG